jgi:hypothetical protein
VFISIVHIFLNAMSPAALGATKITVLSPIALLGLEFPDTKRILADVKE